MPWPNAFHLTGRPFGHSTRTVPAAIGAGSAGRSISASPLPFLTLERSTSVVEKRTVSPTRKSSIGAVAVSRSEEHTSELQSLMRRSYAVFCLKQKQRSTERKEY